MRRAILFLMTLFLSVINSYSKDYSGTVVDSLTSEKIGFATVSLLNQSGEKQFIGITDDQGRFTATIQEEIAFIKISFIGYKTIEQRIDNLNGAGDLGVFRLAPNVSLLGEVSVQANTVEHKVDRTVHVITPAIRKGTFTAPEMLGNILGLRFDRINDKVLVNNKSNVLILVDGIQKSQEYVNSLDPSRIQEVEIVKEPTGRYISDDYSAVINLVLIKEYEGYCLNMRNLMIISPSGSNGDNGLANEQPKILFNYTKNRWNVYANYVYADIHWNYANRIRKTYSNVMDVTSEKVTSKNPNEDYDYFAHAASVGMDYQIAKDHSISIQDRFSYEDTRTDLLYNQQVSYLKSGLSENIRQRTLNQDLRKNNSASIFYVGKLNERLTTHSDLTYDYYSSDLHHLYDQNRSLTQDYKYVNAKNYIRFNADADYMIASNLSLNSGYTSIWNNYRTKDSVGNQLSLYNEYRNRLFAYLFFSPIQTVSAKVGVAVENLYTKNLSSERNYWGVLPFAQLNYAAHPMLNLNLSYNSSISYPRLFQLSPSNYALDSLMMQTGNLGLVQTMNHQTQLEMTFLQCLTLTSTFAYSPNAIEPLYSLSAGKYYSTYANVSGRMFALGLDYNQSLGEFLNWNSSAGYYNGKVMYNGTQNS
ncbi:MAG: outer membrane beta-barrel protein [Bacteroidales bacterium]|nr:outer membrane beta-barrel protein [Bacteroidales bacterium]